MNSQGFKVQVYAWDLQGIPKQVLKALSKISDITDGAVPKYYLHVGIAIYNRFYHYNQTGLQVNLEVPKGFKYCGGINYTMKSQIEFENWFIDQRNNYKCGTYDMIQNNCISFAEDACKFLQVPFEGPQADLNHWLALHESQIRPLEKRILKSRILRAFGVPSTIPKKNRTCVDSANYMDSDFSSDDDSMYEDDNNNRENEEKLEFVTID